MDRSHPVSTRVIGKVAEREGVNPAELDRPLYDAIDPDGLDALFAPMEERSKGRSGRVRFRYSGYWITVDSSGDIEITERETSVETAEEETASAVEQF